MISEKFRLELLKLRVSGVKQHQIAHRARLLPCTLSAITSQIIAVRPGDPKVQVDHRDHNGLNCQRDNLRLATSQQNQHNRHPQRFKAARFKGIYKHGKKWQAAISINNRKHYLGNFTSELVAAMAYDLAALEHFGEFAHTNLSEAI